MSRYRIIQIDNQKFLIQWKNIFWWRDVIASNCVPLVVTTEEYAVSVVKELKDKDRKYPVIIGEF